ncbi:MAG TPA: hypothetical protein VNF27_01230 [Candidatus Binataceae bacterium]|nr:hypothetical protein [Candidatus Binataceae bacterium]
MKELRSMHMRAMVALVLAGALTAFARQAAAAPEVKLLGFSSADFEILDPANLSVIGHAHYAVIKDGNGIALHGDDRYTNGQYDFERDRFETLPGVLPVLTSADHYFFLANGAPEFQSNFDVKSGLASCADFRTQPPQRQTAQLTPPADTWAGASVMIPIQDFLRRGGAGTLDTHVFNCAPSPKIFAVKVTISQVQAQSPLGRPDVVEVDVKPDFGWLNLLLAPFVPHLNAWFDPHRGWEFVGAALARFYKGTDIMLARVIAPAQQMGAAQPAPRK